MPIQQVINSSRQGVSKLIFEGGWEGTYLDTGDSSKFIICLSSMYGCPVSCKFCHLTDLGLNKNWRKLTAEEIALQITTTLKYKREKGLIPIKKDCVVSFMGMGEPLLNIENVLASIELIEKTGAEYIDGNFRYDLATMLPKNASLSSIPSSVRMRIFYSLHTSNENLRRKLVPNSKTIQDAFLELGEYYQRTGIRPIVNYTFIDGVNDSYEETDRLINLFTQPENIDFQFRILRYNPFDQGAEFFVSDVLVGKQQESRRLLEIIESLEKHINVKIHRSLGYDVKGACGQFAGDVAFANDFL